MTSWLRRNLNMMGGLCLLVVLLAGTAPDSPMADAAMEGNLDVVRKLVAGGTDVNAPQGDGMTALHWAAERGDTEMIDLLVVAGARLDAVTRNGRYTPLHLAGSQGNASVIRLLLEAGADPEARSSTDVTPLHFTAGSGSVDAVRALLEHGASADARETAMRETPLMFAAFKDRGEVVQALLQAGADASLATTVVDVVARNEEDARLREVRNARKMLEWNRDLPDRGYRGSDKRDEKQGSEAHVDKGLSADQERDTEEADEGEPQQRLSFAWMVGKKGGMTALHFAAREGNEQAARRLLEGGAPIDLRSADGSTPLLIATINGHFDLAMQLVAVGADPTIPSDAGATPLYGVINLQWGPGSWYPQPTAHRQQRTPYLKLMEALLEAGADPNARIERELWYTEYSTVQSRLSTTRWGATPFWRAAYGLDVEAMKLLVEYLADPSIPTQKKPWREGDGYLIEVEGYPVPPVPVGGPALYPIHAATGAGYGLGHAGQSHRYVPGGWLPAVKYLVAELGADVNVQDHLDYTPLHNAAARGDTEMVLYLVEQGADVKAVNRFGQTTADMANSPFWGVAPFPDLVKLLESLGSVNNHDCQSC